MPTFMVFKNGAIVTKVLGADPKKLSQAVEKLAAEAGDEGSGSGSGSGGFGTGGGSGGKWLGASLPKGYGDVTDEVDVKGLDLLNADSAYGSAGTLFEAGKPSGLVEEGKDKGKGKEKATSSSTADAPSATTATADWIESDTDEQVMLYMPFKASLRIHSLHITSLPPSSSSSSSTTSTSNPTPTLRPKTLKLYTNTAHVLGFDEADGIPPTQEMTLSPGEWDDATGTAKVELRFVKFQNVTSLVLFVIDGEGEGEKVRLDRIRVVGEAGGRREMGKLEKIGDEPGE